MLINAKSSKEMDTKTRKHENAPITKRISAYLFDFCFPLLFTFAQVVAFSILKSDNNSFKWHFEDLDMYSLMSTLFYVVFLAYYYSKDGQTPGAKRMGIKVVKEDDNSLLTLFGAIQRASLLSIMPQLLWWTIFIKPWSTKCQFGWDLLSHSKVIINE